jgi:PAS domain S-box-containing protein
MNLPFFARTGRQLLSDELEHTVEMCEDSMGGYFIVSVSPLHDSNGKLAGCIHVARNINERREAEETLKKAYDHLDKLVKERTNQLLKAYNSLKVSEKRLAEAQKMSHIGNWELDLITNKIYLSDELYRIFNPTSRELVSPHNEYLSYVHPKDRDYVANAFKKSINGEPCGIDHRIILANGEERTVHLQSEAIFDEKKIPIRLKGIVQDITERKKAEEKIQSLANIVESSNDAIITISLDGIITSWNKGAEHIYGYSSEEIIEKDVSILAPENLKNETKKLIEKVKLGEKIQHYRTLRLRKGGKLIDVSIVLSPVFDAAGDLAAISAIVRDITQRIESEKSQVKAENAKKKEIHHRIKNNLQVISSLLDLQAEKFKNRECIKDSEVLEAFRESQDRVISMALIHEELYKGEGFETLDFSTYIRELVENLFQTYVLNSKDIHLHIDMEENIFLDMDAAIPLGIIVNELVSNSLKHAFIGKDSGGMYITLCREKNGERINSIEESKYEGCKSTSFILKVSDDGIGISKSIDLENPNSLGIQLVTTLVDQLAGELELKRNNETEFTIRFTVTEKRSNN